LVGGHGDPGADAQEQPGFLDQLAGAPRQIRSTPDGSCSRTVNGNRAASAELQRSDQADQAFHRRTRAIERGDSMHLHGG
jgi:hypothetical protein